MRFPILATFFCLLLSVAPALAQEGGEEGSSGGAATDTGGSSEGSGGGGPDALHPFEPLGSGGRSLTERPFFFGAGGGLFVGLRGYGAAFQAEENIGYRFFGFDMGEREGALWAGLSFGQGFGFAGDDFMNFRFQLRGGVDFEVWDGGDLQLLVTPHLSLGGAVTLFSGPDPLNVGRRRGYTYGWFDLMIAAQVELVMLDGMLGIWLRPLSFDFLVADGWGGQYELLGGISIRL